MQLLSCSTLHRDYIPKKYENILLTLWCGIGLFDESYYVSDILEGDVAYAEQFRKDIENFSQSGIEVYTPTHATPPVESIQNIQDALLGATVQKKKKHQEYYKSLLLCYVFEEQHSAIQKEYAILSEQYQSLSKYMPTIQTSVQEGIEYDSSLLSTSDIDNSFYTSLAEYIAYCSYMDISVLLASHSSTLYALCAEENLCKELPSNIENIVREKNMLQYCLGYVDDIRGLFPLQICNAPVAMVLLEE